MVTNSSVQGSSFFSSISEALNPFGGPQFQATLTIYNGAGVALDAGTIQAELDAEFQTYTGNPVTTSSISAISGGGGSEQPQIGGTVQNISTPSVGIFASLGSGSVVMIAIVAILIIAIVIAPETPARVARSFV